MTQSERNVKRILSVQPRKRIKAAQWSTSEASSGFTSFIAIITHNMAGNYPLSSKTALASQYVGKRLQDLHTPAIVLDRSKIKKNCAAMLQVCKKLDVGFRAHVKSHKTLELAAIQVGETGPANFIVSTLAEAENLAGFVVDLQAQGREASVSHLGWSEEWYN